MNVVNRLASTFALLACVAAFAAPASAFKMQQQPACAGICKVINNSTALPVLVRSFTFNSPSAGKATVHFHGSMICSGTAGFGFNLTSQIMDVAGGNPNAIGPGGLKFFGRADASAGDMPFNLASNRVFNVTSGNNVFNFKIGAGGGTPINPNTICFVYNASFTVIMLP
jgi:hypothetical protein